MVSLMKQLYQKSKIIYYTFAITSCLIIFMVLLALGGMLIDPDKPYIHYILNRPGQVETSEFSLSLPTGWQHNVYDDFNGDVNIRVIDIYRFMRDSDKQRIYSWEPTISLWHRKSQSHLGIIGTELWQFVRSEQDAESFEKTIDGRRVLFWKFTGQKCPRTFAAGTPSDPNAIAWEDTIATTTIVFRENAEYGFEGFFWGFPEDEEVFLQTLESITWND